MVDLGETFDACALADDAPARQADSGSADEIKWSPQQADFIAWAANGRGSCVLEAVAGAGKTTVILAAVERMRGGSIILAYNTKIANEIAEKLQKRGVDWRKAEAKTVHSIGFRNYRKAFKDVVVNEFKSDDIISKMIANGDLTSSADVFRWAIVKIVSYAKQRALGVEGMPAIDDAEAYYDIIDHFDVSLVRGEKEESEDEMILAFTTALVVDSSIAVMKASIEKTGVIDFDDMVYMPLVHNVRMWQYDNVFIDEAQDTNPARRCMVRALVKPYGGRVIAVGDSRQAIYGFTGADSNSLDLMADWFTAIRMPLTVSYRCPREIVKFARQWVEHIEPADTAPQGSVSTISKANFLKMAPELAGESVVLCRNTMPIVELALQLIRSKVACRVEGRDIGANLKTLATKWTSIKTLSALDDKLDSYSEKQKEKLKAKRQESRIQQLEDRVGTLKVLSEDLRKKGRAHVVDLEALIDEIFADNSRGILTLSTIHKSKGREWPRVFWLNRAGTLPSPYATQEWQKEQEDNLCYVAATRAQEELIEINREPKPINEEAGR
jgi:DNA helicase II / ATP-dependent DNA helicase PcrA